MLLVVMALGAVSWSAPSSCPPESELQARLAGVQSRVDARVQQLDTGFQLELTVDDQQRTIISPSCHEALESAVLIVELAGQWQSKRRPLEIGEEPAPPPPVVETKVTEPEPRRFHLVAIGGAEWELLPQPVARLGISAQLDVDWLRVVLDLRTSPSLRFIRPGLENAGLVLTPRLDLQLGACHLFEAGRLGFGPCVHGGFGLVEASGLNLEFAQTTLVPVWNVGAGARASFAIVEALELQAFFSVRFGSPPRYVFGDVPTTLIVTKAYGFDGGLGFGVRW